MNKRILSLILTMLLAFTFVPINLSADADYNKSAEDGAEEFVTIITGGIKIAKDNVTRAEFVSAMCKALNITAYQPAVPVFSDVGVTYEYAGAIDTAYKLGWVSGTAGKFEPSQLITYPEAVKIAVCALGYGDVAAAEGGYPTGYLYVAGRLGLTDRINFTSSDNKLTYGRLCIFVENMLNANIAKIVGNGIMTTYNTEETALEYYYNIYKVKGIIDSTKNSSLTSADSMHSQNVITLNGETYYYNGYTDDLLGYNVHAYYHKDDNADVKRIVYLKFMNNTVETLSTEDYSHLDGMKLHFCIDGSTKTAVYRVSDTYNLVYNSKKVTDKENFLTYLAEANGYIKLLDNNGDGVYDVVFIDDYKYILVSEVNESEEIISDKNSPENMINLSETDYIIRSFDTGEETDLGSIKIGSVVAAAVSSDGTVGKLYLCDASEGGKPETYESDEVVLNGNTYNISDYYTKYYSSNISRYEDGVYYIGINNDIVAYSSSATAMRYGYVAGIQNDSSKLAPSYKIKLLTDNSRIEVYDLADRVMVDGILKDAKDVDLSGSVDTLIRYGLRGGLVKYIDTAEPLTKELMFGEKTYDSLTIADIPAGSDMIYRSSSYSFNNAYVVKNSAVFLIDQSDIEKSHVGNSTLLASGYSYSGTVSFYDIDGVGQAGAIVVTKPISEYLGYSTNRYAVMSVAEVIDDEGDYCYEIKVMTHTGNVKSYYMDYDVMPVKKSGKILGFGDLIRFYTDYDDRRIKSATIDFDGDEDVLAPEDESLFSTSLSRAYTMRMGMVYNYNNNYVSMSNTKNPDGTYNFDLSNLMFRTVNTTNLVHIDCDKKRIRKGTQEDFKSYMNYKDDASIIVIADNYTAATGVFIYEK